MRALRSQLATWRGRRLWLLGVGNPERGDDGFGVRLVEALRERLRPDAGGMRLVDAGTCPERYVGEAVRGGCEELVLADAVDFGGAPGALLLAATEELLARPVGNATHRVPLSVLAQYAEGLGARAWLLGVQPASLRAGSALSPEVAGTLEALVELLGQALVAGHGAGSAKGCASGDGDGNGSSSTVGEVGVDS
jgi:hydrogenase maturation protease